MKYIVGLKDREGTRWLYEGHLGGEPLFVKEDEAVPKRMDKNEAYDVAINNASMTDEPFVING